MVYLDDLGKIIAKCRASCANFAPDIILLFFRTSEAMLEPSVIMYIYHGICSAMYPHDQSCVDLGLYPERQDEVQMKSARYITWYRFLWNLPALGLTLFCGSWSDRVGRKLVLVLPCFGTIITVLIYLVSTIKSGYYLPVVLCGAVIRGTFGGSALMLMTIQSAVSDITSRENRTWRFGMLLAMNCFGNVLGYIIMGIVLEVSNFAYLFCIVITLQVACVLWALAFMKDREQPKESPTSDKSGHSLFKIEHIREAARVLTRPRENGGRLHMVLLLVAIIVNQIGREVEGDIVVLFVERRPLNWNKSMYGYLAAVDSTCMGLLVCVILPFLSYKCNVPDMYLISLGIVSKILRLLLLAFSTHTWMVYLAIISGSLIAITVSTLKALISKLVEAGDIGKLFSIVSFAETLSSLFGSLVFSNLYAATAAIFPGFSFVLTAVLYFLLLILMGFLTRDIHSRRTLEEEFDAEKVVSTNNNTINPPQLKELIDSLALMKDVQCNGVKTYDSIREDKWPLSIDVIFVKIYTFLLNSYMKYISDLYWIMQRLLSHLFITHVHLLCNVT